MYYTTKEKAEKEQSRWFKEYNELQEIYEVPRATKWKFWLGSKESWDKELILMERKFARKDGLIPKGKKITKREMTEKLNKIK